jgi:hypothetical protein
MTSAPEILPPPTLAEPAAPRAADPPDDRPTTTSTRTTAVLVEPLFLTATPACITANALNVAVPNRPDFLTGAAADTPVPATGALLVLGQVGVVGIAARLFPLLKRHGEALALAQLGFRVSELAASQALPRGAVAGDRTRNRAAQRHHRRLRIDEFELLLPIWLLAKGFAFACD